MDPSTLGVLAGLNDEKFNLEISSTSLLNWESIANAQTMENAFVTKQEVEKCLEGTGEVDVRGGR